MDIEHGGEVGTQKLDTLPTPTTQTSSPENHDPHKVESHSEVALRKLYELINNGADEAAIEHAKGVVSETVKMEQEKSAVAARAEIAALTGTPAEQPFSHLQEVAPTIYRKLFPVRIQSAGIDQAPRKVNTNPPGPYHQS
jgi:hypothetical protein